MCRVYTALAELASDKFCQHPPLHAGRQVLLVVFAVLPSNNAGVAKGCRYQPVHSL
ncbi:MAG: hypothetical protein VB835_07965 [Pirellulales bacterium]